MSAAMTRQPTSILSSRRHLAVTGHRVCALAIGNCSPTRSSVRTRLGSAFDAGGQMAVEDWSQTLARAASKGRSVHSIRSMTSVRKAAVLPR